MKSAAASTAHVDIGLSLRDVAAAQLTDAARLLGRAGEARHDGVHQARKSLRRARALLLLAERRLGPRVRTLLADLGSLGRGLSVLRDAHALWQTLQRLQKQEPEIGTVFAQALRAADQRRAEVLERTLARDPDLRSRRQRLEQCRLRLLALPWADVNERCVRRGLTRCLRSVQRAQQRARGEPVESEAWHRLRRRMRRLRQQHNILEELAPALLVDVPAHAAAAAERLGEAQDDVLLLKRCGARSPFALPARRVLRALARRRLAQARASD